MNWFNWFFNCNPYPKPVKAFPTDFVPNNIVVDKNDPGLLCDAAVIRGEVVSGSVNGKEIYDVTKYRFYAAKIVRDELNAMHWECRIIEKDGSILLEVKKPPLVITKK